MPSVMMADSECAEIKDYIAHRAANFEEVDNHCASFDSDWLEEYESLMRGDNVSISLGPDKAKQARDYYTACFHSISEIGSVDGVDGVNVRNAFQRSLGVLLRKDDDNIEEFCSAMLIDGGYVAPLHCFIDDNGSLRTNKNESIVLAKIKSYGNSEIEYELVDVTDWTAYSVDGGQNYGSVTETDIVVVVNDSNANRMPFSEQVAEFRCGEKLILAGVSQLYGEALHELLGARKLSDVVLIAGYRSMCVSSDTSKDAMRKHFCSTSGGQSGAPVFIEMENGSFWPVGIHLGSSVDLSKDWVDERSINYMFVLKALVGSELSEVRILP